MNLFKDKYIIVEIIPSRRDANEGFIVQLSALKLEGLKLIDRFDYRVNDNFIDNQDIYAMTRYDKKSFTYVDNIYFIIEKFKQWAGDMNLLLLEDNYTLDYFKELPNKKELIYPYLGFEHEEAVFNKIIEKYNLEPSEHLVDLLYEAIIYESNNHKEDK